MKRMSTFFCALLALLVSQSAFAASGLLFDVTATGASANLSVTLCLNGKGPLSCQNYTVTAMDLAIRTTIPNHVYPSVGIKVNTPGYVLTGCLPGNNGYCLFSASDTTAENIAVRSSEVTIGGSISNLTASGLVLQNNGSDNLIVSSGATSFQFSTPVAFEGSYNVTVFQQPTGLTCTVSNGSGTNVMANITNVSVTCSVDTYTIGGSISGLAASGLVLQNNGGDNLTVSSGASSFQFSTPVAFEGSYNVTVFQQPTGLTCTVSNGSGTNVMADITNVSVTCSVDTYTIGGSISGLGASGLVLQNNGGDNLTVSSGATTFQFSTPVAFGGSYNVTVLQQPTGLTCTVSNGSGTNVMADVTNVTLSCASFVLITNQGADSVSRCTVTNNILSACTNAGATGLSAPTGIVLNPAGTTAFIINGDGATAVSQCPVSGNTLSACGNSGATGITSPSRIVLNAAGTTAFITRSGNGVTQCTVSGSTLSACANAGATGLSAPLGIVLNSAGTTAFIVNVGNNSVTQCSVSGSTLSSCANAGATGLNAPIDIVLNSAGTTAFITNFNSNRVTQCTVSGSTLSACANAGATGLSQPAAIVLNAAGTTIFITNFNDTVTQCTVSGSTLSACGNSGATGLGDPTGIVFLH